MNEIPVERLTELPWHDVARWNAQRSRWLRRGAWVGAGLGLAGIGLCVQHGLGDAAWRVALALSLLAPAGALSALVAHLFARAFEAGSPHPLEDLF